VIAQIHEGEVFAVFTPLGHPADDAHLLADVVDAKLAVVVGT
jgi:hypothetical protein